MQVEDTALDFPTRGLLVSPAVLQYRTLLRIGSAVDKSGSIAQCSAVAPTAARCRAVAAALLGCSSIRALGSAAATAFELRGIETGGSRRQEGRKRGRASSKVSFLV